MPIVVVNFKELRRAMSVTPIEPCRLTRDGVVYDHVRYRFNAAAVEDVLDAGDRFLPAGLRTPGTAVVLVMIRVWHDDIDMIEVFDPETNTFLEMWSTEPEYTSGLSRWEHHQYLAMIRAGKGGASSEVDRLALKGRSLREQDEILPHLAFRERAAGSALVEQEGFRRASGRRARRDGFADVPELGATMTSGAKTRDDLPTTPPQSSTKRGSGRRRKAGNTSATAPIEHRAPPREPDYGLGSLAREQLEDRRGSGRQENDEEHRAARLARWAALAVRAAPVLEGGSDEPRTGDGGASVDSTDDYHLRDDRTEIDDETEEAVSYDGMGDDQDEGEPA